MTKSYTYYILYSIQFKVFGVNEAKVKLSFERSKISKLKLFYYFNKIAKRQLFIVEINCSSREKMQIVYLTKRLLL